MFLMLQVSGGDNSGGVAGGGGARCRQEGDGGDE